ncbi:hypothetical protein J18TS1_07400 [Oceanobacillus oncorhynchi subsp. incaldanensis]|uniref:Uncharacterized protein n=1 Tax=Oceanobacillus oncorhynchi TaxID=545501 RepID=A0A0A1MTL4_9BACI
MGQNTITLDPDEKNATSIPEIEKEYARLDKDWLWFHYKLSIWLVIFTFIIECLLSLIIVRTDLLSTSVPIYIWRFIAVPSILNVIFLAIGTAVMYSKRISHQGKNGGI